MAAPIGACFGAPCITCRRLAGALDSKAAGGGGVKTRKATQFIPVLAQRAASDGVAQRREELSLVPTRAPSEGPRSTAAVESSSRPCLARR